MAPRNPRYPWKEYEANFQQRKKRIAIDEFLKDVNSKEEIIEKLMSIKCKFIIKLKFNPIF